MGLDTKVDALLSLAPDVAVVPECAEKSLLALRTHHRMNTLWFGSNPRKGLGIVCRQDWPMIPLPPAEETWIVPVEIGSNPPFNLIAVWACPSPTGKKQESYIGQVYRALVSHPEWFNNGHPVVVAGDFNSNTIWDASRKSGNHSDVVSLLEERGLVSAYHLNSNEPHGTETTPTFHLYRHQGRPFHLDYIFVPQPWTSRLRAVEVGPHDQWSKLSDHCPVTVDILW